MVLFIFELLIVELHGSDFRQLDLIEGERLNESESDTDFKKESLSVVLNFRFSWKNIFYSNDHEKLIFSPFGSKMLQTVLCKSISKAHVNSNLFIWLNST